MCEAIDNSNSACRIIKIRLITVQGSRVTLIATVMTGGEPGGGGTRDVPLDGVAFSRLD